VSYDYHKIMKRLLYNYHKIILRHFANALSSQICPKYRPDLFDGDKALGMLDTSLTPSALKKISKSVMDLSNMSEMQEISKSTSNLVSLSSDFFFSSSLFEMNFNLS